MKSVRSRPLVLLAKLSLSVALLVPYAAVLAQSALVTYSAAQAERGKTAYGQSCAQCHGPNLDDGEFGPPLHGAAFNQHWAAKPADGLFTYMHERMPPSSPGSLGADVYADVLAYLVQAGGAAPGDKDLPAEAAKLSAMVLPGQPGPGPGPGGGLSPYTRLPAWPAAANPLDQLTPVTDQMLTQPADADWLTWRRTWDALGFSPLRQVDRRNVSSLQVAWTWSLPNGPNESTPLVHDGVIYVHSFGDKVQALDAVSGDLLWQYSRELPKDALPTVKRNIALYGNRVFLGTSDLHLVALDAKTGKVVWDQPLADYRGPVGARLTGGPLAAKGKVMIGTVGRAPGGCLIIAFDADSGREAWRFHTIAQPGEAYGDSWNGLPVEKRNGGSVWTAGSYDPALGLAYFGVAQTYDTGPLLHPVKQRGVSNDGLYTDSTVAIDPDTGKPVWHFQHMPNDQWDFDWAFERHLLKLSVDGQERQVALTGGKEGIFDALDARSGKYLFSFDLGVQNLITAIDPKTGAKTTNPALLPGDGQVKMVCPHAGGARSWIPASLNPLSKVLFLPMVESCMDMIPVGPGEHGSLSSGVRWTLRPRPDSDGKYGRIEAFDLTTRKPLWTVRQRAPQSSGALDTAGGVVFAGALDRWFSAYDDSSGALLWRQRLNDVPSSAPISYAVNGRQYIAMVVGNGGAQAVTFPVLVPEIRNPPDHGAALWVFALPDHAR